MSCSARPWCRLLAFIVAVCGAGLPAARSAETSEVKIDYNRDIRPLLSDKCYACHGPDEAQRQAGLRLDSHTAALAPLDSGEVAIVPGDLQQSELIRRITAADAATRMPPADSGKELTAEDIGLLKRWVEQGANWEQHWSFVPPVRPALPELDSAATARNGVDHFVLAKLEGTELSQNPEADKRTLIRRVTFDLTGLPPTPEEIADFLADQAPNAYEKLVDRLLASPQYGEHRARFWLDAARYGDTHGLHLDNERSIWPYRDWVIDAFNRDMPFDEFTVQQLAGDLLPSPTLDQLVATGFNRCNVTTSEGGSIEEEYYVRYAVDRVETTSTVWLGLTTGCAACHDHKFDPITQREFYQLFAFFNSLTEKAMDKNALVPPPSVQVPTPDQKKLQDQYKSRIAELQKTVDAEVAKVDYEDPLELDALPPDDEPADYVWVDDALPAGATPDGDESADSWHFVGGPEHPVHSGKLSTRRQASGRSQHFFTGASTPLYVGDGDKLFAHVYLSPQDPPRQIMLQFNDGSWEHRAYWGEDLIDWGTADSPSRLHMGKLPEAGQWVRLEVAANLMKLDPGAKVSGMAFTQFGGTVYWDTAGLVTKTPQGDATFESQRRWELLQRTTTTTLPDPYEDIVDLAEDERTSEQQQQLRQYFLEHAYAGLRPVLGPIQEQIAAQQQLLTELDKQIPQTLIMEEMPEKRDAFILDRGQYDQPRDKVEAGVPAVLPSLPSESNADRLALARWLVDPQHPLTARVTVNRFWHQIFGIGIVRSTDDFGAQGEWPSHPELLDWLAIEFMKGGWDVKQLQRLLVTSATYRQSSVVSPDKSARDPENRLLARGPRYRLDAEVIRDQALAVSGLLVGTIGGKSVKPYQPPGLWEAVGYTDSNTAKFQRDDGAALYRRSLYTFWKRTSPPPAMAIFDAPTREACTVRRSRTNTPLQALLLMNDEQFVEAARHMARRVIAEGGSTSEGRIGYAFELATGRLPAPEERRALQATLAAHLEDYKAEPDAARALLSVGASAANVELLPAAEASELAAWTLLANLILNLNETITKG